jgi:multiple sugar transport system substrate-binding protein/putative aldouronate transport system substrate-binding protein
VEIQAISAPWAEWPVKLNSLMASGQTPDVFVTYGPGDADGFQKMRDGGALLPLTKYLKQYPNIDARLKRWEAQAKDGEFYALPVEIRLDHTFFIRKDRIDALGMAVPGTIEEFYNVAVALKKAYGGYPISSSPAHTAGFFWLYPIFYAFGGAWEDWVSESNQLMPCWISNGNKEALRYINKLYKDGLLDPDFISNSDADKREKFYSGKASIIMDSEYPSIAKDILSRDQNARLATFGVLNGPGGAGMWGMDGFFTAVSINANLDNAKIKKVLGFFDYLYSSEGLKLLRYGVKDVHWKDLNGKIVPLFAKKGENYVTLQDIDGSASVRGFVEFESAYYPEWTPYAKEREEIFSVAEKYGRYNRFQYDPTTAEKEYGKVVYDIAMKYYVQLARAKDFDSIWNSFMEEFLTNGGREIIEQRNR